MRAPRRNLTTLGYRRIIRLLVYLISVPGVLLSAVGVLLFVLGLGEARYNLLLGILILTFCGTAATGVTLVWLFLRREWNLSELQADFVSKVSHELRTPLTSIRMFSETLALRRGDKATEDRCIEALTKECARLQHLIDRLLDWGRMESGRRTYDIAPHDVKSLIDESIAAFEPTRERRDVELTVSVSRDLPPALCDKSALVDCLVNLLSNAYKYGGDPRVIEIGAEARQKLIEITVRDNGKGIERTEHKRIFEKFYRVDDLLSRKQEGSGLGLSIVRHVVKAHGGKILVESEPGRGSLFTLMLPAATASNAKAGAPKNTEQPPSRHPEGRAPEVTAREKMEG